MDIRELESDDEIRSAFDVMRELRPKLASAEDLLTRVRRLQAQGYHLTAVLEKGHPLALAGWRRLETLYQGPHIYVDDLVTSEAVRSRGLGRALLQHLSALGRQEGLTALTLDSGTQRKDAHRFYQREGLEITCFHFGKEL